ncbi:spore coat protein [Tumebacillus sp. ITR2]|uniref:Spore coat protein n=2 Tax=Tumebacillus amylolyticus TaxID=2801339 RepID=A0ABS1JAY0_9BACL|nr:spore coat protein [Tumebacillus amylolyticus]
MNNQQVRYQVQGQTGGQQGLRFGAHEFLETQEALRCKAADLELYGVLISQAQDPHLRDILANQQNRMVQSYQQCLALANMGNANAGVATMAHTPQTNVYENIQVGLHNPMQPAPNVNAKTLSDRTIATVALNLHKAGAIFGMQWALECTIPQLRGFHATCANVCQEMAYELFQYLNYTGVYQVPQLADHTMNTMLQAFQGQGNTMMTYTQNANY